MVLFILIFVGYFFSLRYFAYIDDIKFEQKLHEKRNFSYCWKRINMLLDQQPGIDGISWDRGQGVNSIVREFTIDKVKRSFFALIARKTHDYNYVHIIYDIDKDNIIVYEDNPGSETMNYPFHNFKPEDSTSGGMYNNINSPFGYNGRNSTYGGSRQHRPGVNISFDDQLGGGGGDSNDNARQREADLIKDKLRFND